MAALVVCVHGWVGCTEAHERSPVCGNGIVEAGEACDPGGRTAECDSDCTRSVCGDGVVNELGGEACDVANGEIDCREDCTRIRCGDGILDPDFGEECDDGNLLQGDGCSTTCLVSPLTCGNGACDEEPEQYCQCIEDCCWACASCDDFSRDLDGDGYYHIEDGGLDCDDGNPNRNPGMREIGCNGVDDDCNPETADFGDHDFDGFDCTVDCDDQDANRAPGNVETCGDGRDNDCDPTTPDMEDLDGDGFTCAVDCDDTNADVNPGMTEVCDNYLDDDCNPDTRDVDGETCELML